MKITLEMIREIRRDAQYTREHIGAPYCEMRERAEAILQILTEYEFILLSRAVPNDTMALAE